jgi:hypothetical protein
VFDDTDRPATNNVHHGGGGKDQQEEEDDLEGADDAEIQQKHDEENMKFAQDRIANKKKSLIKPPSMP